MCALQKYTNYITLITILGFVAGPRVEEAMHRTIRWIDRCLPANERSHDQALFPIVQGGLDEELRKQCAAGIWDMTVV